ncbi:MAG TPA: FAD binding domain-containing protein [Candidatus Eremiobacteraceae bacterium]|nr:FAD binding domain-containing protein [Candidatus Eremiobacteraceae bacterium]
MQYYEPNFVDEALVLLERFGSRARILAGGTRLGPVVRQGAPDIHAIINLKRIEEMCTIVATGATLHIGALATAAQLRRHPAVREHAPLLADAAASMGARQLQTLATLGGNICSGDPASDLSVALLACDAICQIATPNEGVASFLIEEVLARIPPGLTPRELLTEIEIPLGPYRFSYQKMATRRAFEMALVSVSLRCRMEDDVIADARIGLAGAAQTPIRATGAEAVLTGKRITTSVARQAARVAAEADASPQSDSRASDAYRRTLVAVLTERAVVACGQPSSARPTLGNGL